MSDHLKKKKRPPAKRKGQHPQVEEAPLVNYVIPNKFKRCFCNDCWNMYHDTKYPNQMHLLLYIEPIINTPEYAKTMPLLRAFRAFLEDFTGYPVTITVAGLRYLGERDGQKAYEKAKETGITPFYNSKYGPHVDVYLGKDKFNSDRHFLGYLRPAFTPQKSYSYSAGGSMMMKMNILLEVDVGSALMIMVHEFTAHRYDQIFDPKVRKEMTDAAPRGVSSPSYRRHYTHKVSGDLTSHCKTPTCLNSWFDFGMPNHRKLLGLFEQYYDNNHNRPLTLSHEFFSDEPEGYTNATFKIPEPHEIYQIKETGYGDWLNPEEDDPELEALDIRLGLREKDEEDEVEAGGSRYKPLGPQDDDVFVGA